MKRGRGKASQRVGKLVRRKRACLGKRAAAQMLGEERSAGDRGCTPATKETHLGKAAVFHARGEFQDVAADGIRDFDGRGGVRKLAGIARLAEMIENGFAEHFSLRARSLPAAGGRDSKSMATRREKR